MNHKLSITDSTWTIISGLGGGLSLILLVCLAYYIYWRKVVYKYWDTNEMGEEMSEIPRSVDFTEIAIGNVLLPNDEETPEVFVAQECFVEDFNFEIVKMLENDSDSRLKDDLLRDLFI